MMMVLVVGTICVIVFVRMQRDPLITRTTGKRTEVVRFDHYRSITRSSSFIIPAVLILIRELFSDSRRWLAMMPGPGPGVLRLGLPTPGSMHLKLRPICEADRIVFEGEGDNFSRLTLPVD